MEETPAIEKGIVEEVTQRTRNELETAQRIDLGLLRNKDENHTFFIEFDNMDAVIKCTIKKGIPWQRMSKARKNAKNVIKKADGTITAEIDQNAMMRDLWSDVVVATDPKITVGDLDTFSGLIAAQIITKVFEEFNTFAPDIKVRKK